MSREKHEDDCPGCRPTVWTPEGGKLPDNHPVMQEVNRAWDMLSLETRQAFHRITCLNSRDPQDFAHMQSFIDLISAAIDKAAN